jgi:predicted HD superfamily hydrolase involved in NAD metabolism
LDRSTSHEPAAQREILSMSGAEFLRLCKAMRGRMGVGRFRHCAGVARMAEKLAVRFAASPLKARVAGILHDVARTWTGEQLIAYAEEHGIPVSGECRLAPVLLHAAVGADIARSEYGVHDPDVLGAIVHHTIAGPNMTDLEKIVYLADTFEPSRKFEEQKVLEAAAFRSLDEGLLLCLHESMKYLSQKRITIAQETVELYDEMVKRNAGAP